MSSSIWRIRGQAVGGVVAVLFTLDRRVFLMLADGTFRVARDWERDEVLRQMLSWMDSAAPG
jgi:hypothetical protein